MSPYLAFPKEDEETTRNLLKEVNQQLELISQNVNSTPPEIRWLSKPAGG